MTDKRPILRTVRPTTIHDLPPIPKVKTTKEQKILEYISNHKDTRLKELYRHFKVDEGSIRTIVRRLVRNGKIKQRICECGMSKFYDKI